MRVGLVQLRTPMTQAESLAQVLPLVRQAADEGARFIATPEATNILQRDRAKLALAVTSLEDDAVVQGLREAAADLGVQLLIGSALVRREDGQCANRAILVGPDGGVQATYDKIHMFDVDLPTGERHRESSLYTPGEAAVVAPTAFGPLGLSICYDLRFPLLYHALAQAGAVAIAIPAAFTRPTGVAHWETLMRARAIETGAYILAPAQGGVHADGRATWGRSMIVEPWGEVIAKLDHDDPGVLVADLDADKVTAARAAIPALANARAFAGPQRADSVER
ncbi:MAG: carbon-nitrogen hydrolase family protein [Caulobacteraceae bacterium]